MYRCTSALRLSRISERMVKLLRGHTYTHKKKSSQFSHITHRIKKKKEEITFRLKRIKIVIKVSRSDEHALSFLSFFFLLLIPDKTLPHTALSLAPRFLSPLGDSLLECLIGYLHALHKLGQQRIGRRRGGASSVALQQPRLRTIFFFCGTIPRRATRGAALGSVERRPRRHHVVETRQPPL